MKIKHWQGYGTVNAVKVKDDSCTLHVKVTGSHECGLERDDEYDLFNWLVKRFDKTLSDYRDFANRNPKIVIKNNYGSDVDVCDYYFTY